MESLHALLDGLLHLDAQLAVLIQQYGHWIYAILFLIVFCETGLVFMPLLPGDSLLFAAGTMAAAGDLSIHSLILLLIAAAILGDSVNYAVGHWFGPKIFRKETGLFFNKAHLLRAEKFYEQYGGKAIILARFMPIVRTFVPFVAGIGSMAYPRFFAYNVIGAILWVGSICSLSYWFGNLPWVKQNFTSVILAIIFLSLLPAVFEYWRSKRKAASLSRCS